MLTVSGLLDGCLTCTGADGPEKQCIILLPRAGKKKSFFPLTSQRGKSHNFYLLGIHCPPSLHFSTLKLPSSSIPSPAPDNGKCFIQSHNFFFYNFIFKKGVGDLGVQGTGLGRQNINIMTVLLFQVVLAMEEVNLPDIPVQVFQDAGR